MDIAQSQPVQSSSPSKPSSSPSPSGVTPQLKKQQPPSHLSKVQQIQPPMPAFKPKFQPTPVGIIYEEISLLDAFDDNSGMVDFPSLFDTQINFSQYCTPVSESALELQAKPETRAKVASHSKKRNENRRKEFGQNVGPVSTKEANGKQFKFDEKKAAPYLHSTKLKNFLVHAGNGKNLARIDPLAGSFNINSKREATVRTSAKLTELLAGHQTSHNPNMKNGNLPLLKPPSQPKKELIKTSYLPFFNSGKDPMEIGKRDDPQQSIEHNAVPANKARRPKSGENTTAALRKIYIGAKEKGRRFVWNSPNVNA